MLTHCFPEKFHPSLLVTALGNEAFENLAFVIHRSPEIVLLAINLHKDLVQMPPPPARFQALDPAFRISDANIGPNRSHQNRTVSWLMSIPRSCNRSSTFLSESGNRT